MRTRLVIYSCTLAELTSATVVTARDLGDLVALTPLVALLMIFGFISFGLRRAGVIWLVRMHLSVAS
jgi:hypothetical protein